MVESTHPLKPLKAAFCFSGQLRTWRECYPTWQRLFEYFDTPPDIFCHVWDFNTPPHSLSQNQKVEQVSYDEINEYIGLLKPKSYLVEDYTQAENINLQVHLTIKDLYKCYSQKSPYWLASQYYGMDRAATLKEEYEVENSIRYDVVFRMRNDLFFDETTLGHIYNGLKLSEHSYPNIPESQNKIFTFNSLEPFTVYASHSKSTDKWPFMLVGDTFFFSNSTTYDLVCKYWNNIAYLFTECFVNRDISPEGMFFYYLKTLFLEIKPLLIDLKVKRTPEYFEVKALQGVEPYKCDI